MFVICSFTALFFHSCANFVIAKQLSLTNLCFFFFFCWKSYSNTLRCPQGPTKLTAEHKKTHCEAESFAIPHTCLCFCGWTKERGFCCLHSKCFACFLPWAKLIRIFLKSAINLVDYIEMNACASKLSSDFSTVVKLITTTTTTKKGTLSPGRRIISKTQLTGQRWTPRTSPKAVMC